ncbi:MAG: hypothetical protein ACHREM_32770, partial [Polyangiales bacterium]
GRLGLLLFLGALLPTSNLVPTTLPALFAERFVYIPLVGVALVVAAILARATATSSTRVAASFVALIALAMLTASMRRSADYDDEADFWAHELALHPESPAANTQALRLARTRNDLREALRIATSSYEICARSYPQVACDVDMVVSALDVLSRLTPDRDVARLQALDRCASELLDPAVDVATLDAIAPRAKLRKSTGLAARKLEALRPKLLELRADFASRLGDDASANARMNEARAACPTCVDATQSSAMMRARAGLYEDARSLLAASRIEGDRDPNAAVRAIVDRAFAAHTQAAATDDPLAKAVLRAQELATLELWGRALDAALPGRDAIEATPALASDLARIAWHAGAFTIAREILAKSMPADRVDRQTRAWSVSLGWERAPTP